MKTNKLLTIVSFGAIALGTLGSCAGYGDVISKNLAKLEEGFTLIGNVKQDRLITELDLDGTPGETTTEKQNYDVKIQYENSKDRIGGCITHMSDANDPATIFDQVSAFIDDEGNCYSEYLDYKNEIQVRKINEGLNNLSFTGAGLFNFASILNSSDFTYKTGDDEYYVNRDKMSVILKNILGHNNAGFMYTPLFCTLKLKNGIFDTLEVKMESYHTIKAQENVLFAQTFDNSVTFKFTNIGNTKMPTIAKVPYKSQNSELKQAFSKLGDNFTLKNETALSVDNGMINRSYRMFKFDGEKVLIKDYLPGSTAEVLTPDNHFLLKKLDSSASDLLYCHIQNATTGKYEKREHKDFAKNYQGVYYYEDLLIYPSIISSDFFDYDSSVNEYICKDGQILNQIKPLLITSKAPLTNNQALNAAKVGIRVGDDGNIKYIKFYVNYTETFSGTYYQGYVKVSISNIGVTTI